MKEKLLYKEKKIIKKIVDQYGSNCKKLLHDIELNVVREFYGRGGNGLHRGYYCPSLISDIIVGGVSRGRIYNKLTSPDYIYGFDSADKLILVKNADAFECIVYQDAVEIGITISKDFHIIAITYCSFCDGKISEHLFCLYDFCAKKIIEITKEKYTYFSDMFVVDWLRTCDYKSIQICEQEKYTFNLVDGYMDNYTVEAEYDSKKILIGKYKISKKRKICL